MTCGCSWLLFRIAATKDHWGLSADSFSYPGDSGWWWFMIDYEWGYQSTRSSLELLGLLSMVSGWWIIIKHSQPWSKQEFNWVHWLLVDWPPGIGWLVSATMKQPWMYVLWWWPSLAHRIAMEIFRLLGGGGPLHFAAWAPMEDTEGPVHQCSPSTCAEWYHQQMGGIWTNETICTVYVMMPYYDAILLVCYYWRFAWNSSCWRMCFQLCCTVTNSHLAGVIHSHPLWYPQPSPVQQ